MKVSISKYLMSAAVVATLGWSGTGLAAEQIVAPTPQSQAKSAGDAVSFTVSYSTANPNNPNLTGLGLRVHFNSSKVTYVGLTNLLQTGLLGVGTPEADTQDFDNDPLTDQFVLVAWVDFNGHWPGTEPTQLFTANFTAAAGSFGSTNIRFSASSTAQGYTLSPAPALVTVAPAGSGGLFYTLPPCRVLDTRMSLNGFNGLALLPYETRGFNVAGVCGIPSGAAAISANVTVTNVGALGELVVFPSDVSQPNTSSISFRAGRTRANNAIVSLSHSSTTFSVFNNSTATVDFILDVNGSFRNVAGGGGLTGVVNDPTGDTFADGPAPYPDLVEASARVQSGSCTFSVRFAPGTYNSALTGTQLLLDTDQNPASGYPGSDSSGVNDVGIIGCEYIVSADMPTSSAAVLRYDASAGGFTYLGNFGSVTTLVDGFDVMLPLAAIGNDDGRMNFKIICYTNLPGSGSTGVLDYMPNVGQPAGRIE